VSGEGLLCFGKKAVCLENCDNKHSTLIVSSIVNAIRQGAKP
jgi:hypothetical protein